VKRGPSARLGDLMRDLLEKWNNAKDGERAKPDAPPAVTGDEPQASNRGLSQVLRSWRKGGAEIPVTKAAQGRVIGTSTTPAPTKIATPPAKQAQTIATKQNVAKPAQERLPHNRPSPASPPVKTKVTSNVPAQPASARTVETQPRKPPLRDRLYKASADIRRLKIGGAASRRIGSFGETPVIENREGKIAVLGLDFGTAFTKAVVQWAGYHHAVDWSLAVAGEDPYLMASVFSEAADGSCVLGACNAAGWQVHEGIKIRLLSSSNEPDASELADSVVFLALSFRYVDAWLRKTHSAQAQAIRWRLHVGLPTISWDSQDTTAAFKTAAQAARLLACSTGRISRRAALEALSNTHLVDRPAVDVFPEFACQLYSYLRSSERQDDLHALVDIGAGTLDVAFFNVFVRDGDAMLPVFAADVQPLGAHYLIAALAGERGVDLAWEDADSSGTDTAIATRIGDVEADVASRRKLYLSTVAEMFNGASTRARAAYATSPAFCRGATVRLFLCGGGSRIHALKKHFERIEQESAKIAGIKFQVSELVRPDNIVGATGANFDRLSVAYGLSQHGANIGSVLRRSDLSPLLSSERREWRGRDDDR